MSPEQQEVLDLLWESARRGAVSAQRALLEHYRRQGEEVESDAFKALDELAPRRQGQAGA
jgi:hypothetical protein